MEHLVHILNKEPAKTIFQVQNNKDDIISQLKGISQLRPEFETRVTNIHVKTLMCFSKIDSS